MRWKNLPGIDEHETLWSERGMFELVIFKRSTVFKKPPQNEDSAKRDWQKYFFN